MTSGKHVQLLVRGLTTWATPSTGGLRREGHSVVERPNTLAERYQPMSGSPLHTTELGSAAWVGSKGPRSGASPMAQMFWSSKWHSLPTQRAGAGRLEMIRSGLSSANKPPSFRSLPSTTMSMMNVEYMSQRSSYARRMFQPVWDSSSSSGLTVPLYPGP